MTILLNWASGNVKNNYRITLRMRDAASEQKYENKLHTQVANIMIHSSKPCDNANSISLKTCDELNRKVTYVGIKLLLSKCSVGRL